MDDIIARSICLGMAAVSLCVLLPGFTKRRVRLPWGKFRRRRDPIWYWSTMGAFAALLVAGLFRSFAGFPAS